MSEPGKYAESSARYRSGQERAKSANDLWEQTARLYDRVDEDVRSGKLTAEEGKKRKDAISKIYKRYDENLYWDPSYMADMNKSRASWGAYSDALYERAQKRKVSRDIYMNR